MNDLIDTDKAKAVIKEAGSAWFKGKVAFILLGAFLSTIAWAGSGYWDFRKAREAFISERYVAFLNETKEFENSVMAHAVVFGPSHVDLGDEPSLRLSAAELMSFVDSLAVTLPSTQERGDELVTTISELALLVPAEQSADYGSEEWALAYGQLRSGLDSYLTARNEFNVAVNASAGSYLQYVSR